MAVQDKDKLVSLEDLKTAYDDLDGDISDVKNTLNHKADVIYDTASGDIASFPDGADGLPVKDLTVTIEPVQDLHGYANPWPAGGGKNILPLTLVDIKANNTSGTWNGNAYTLSNITYTVIVDSDNNVIGIKATGTTSSRPQLLLYSGTIKAGSYILNGCPSGGSGTTYQMFVNASGTYYLDRGSGESFTLASDTNCTVNIDINAMSNANLTFYPMIRLSSVSDATFAPYSNICPISGWTGANVSRTGKNLCYSVENFYFYGSDAHPRSDVDVKSVLFYAIKGEKYTRSSTPASNRSVLARVDSTVISTSTNLLETTSTEYTAQTWTATWTGWTLWYCYAGNATQIAQFEATAQIELGSTASAYEAYQGSTLLISWQSSAGTVYGGTLDVTTGVLTVDRAIVDLGTLSGTYNASTKRWAFYINGMKYTLARGDFILSDRWTTDTSAQSGSEGKMFAYGGAVYLYTSDGENSPTGQLVYELATPQTYQLTPTEATTLLGQNNIWADTGDSTVEYPCDTKLYIERLTAPEEDDMIANSNIASGVYFMVGNNLYLSTSAILVGDPIKPGTNCTLTNLAAALNAINS